MATTPPPAARPQVDELHALHELASALARTDDLDVLGERALDGVRRALRAERASILLVDDTGRMRFCAWHGLSDDYRAAVDGHSPWPLDAGDAQPVVVPDVDDDSELAPLRDVIRREGIRSVVFVPISDGARLLGKYMLYFDQPRTLSAEELEVARAAAGMIAVALGRRGVEQELRESRDQLEAILRGVADGITVQRADGELLYANDQAAQMLGFETAEELVQTPVAKIMERFEVLDEDGELLPVDRLPARRVLSGEDQATAILRYRSRQTAAERWSEVRATPVRGPDGVTRLAVNVFRDVTDRRRLEEWQRVLMAAGDAVTHALDVRQTVGQIADFVVPSLADWCVVDLVAEDGSITTAALAHRDPQRVAIAEELRSTYPPDTGATTGVAAVVRTGEAVLYETITDDLIVSSARDERHLELLRALDLRSAMLLPLRARGRTLGVLTLVSTGVARAYDRDDLVFGEDLGRRLAVALDNAALYEAEQSARAEAEQTTKRLRQLQEIAEIGLEARSLDELLDRLLTFVRSLLGGDRATMLLLDQDRNELRVRAAVGLAPEVIEQVHVPFGKGIAGTIASTGRPRVIGDLTKANPISAYLRHSGGSLVGVPLRVDDRVLGVLHVTTDRKHAFSELDLGFLELVGERAALALERTAAYEHEHATALTLQRSVLPRRLPDLERVDLAARYLPGSHGLVVGGDWYDAFELRGGRIGLVVGDVVGKGVEAAAAMAQIRNALRVYALDGLKPSTIVTRLRELPVETFATVVIASVDPGRSICRYANAGHPPPLLLRVDGSATYLEGGRSTPLGADFDVRSAESSVDLAEGDTLLLYTDGLVESRARSLADGLALLEQSIRGAPRELEALLDHVVDRMLDPDALPDDVALLAFRLQPTVKKLLSLRHRNTGSELTSIRRRLASWLEALGIAPRVVGDIVLAANELCANAIEHAIAPAQAAIEVAGELEGRTVTVEVRDFGTWREPVERDDRGFGLPLVTALMDELEITPGPDGTRSRARKRVALAR